MVSRGRIVLMVVGGVVVVAGVLVAVRYMVGRQMETIHRGHDTTRVMGPVHADGTVDYVAALNAEGSAGVTVGNNGAAVMREVLGENFASPTYQAALEKEWGFPPMRSGGGPNGTVESFSAWLKKRDPKSPLLVDSGTPAEERADKRRESAWKSGEDPLIAAWLKDQAGVMEVAEKASGCERWFLPRVLRDPTDSLFEAQMPAIGAVRTVANALVMRAMLRRGEGDIAGCRADLLAAHRLGRQMSQSLSVFEYLVGASIVSQAAKADAAAAAGLGEAAIRAMLAERDALPAVGEAWRVYDIGERYQMLSIITNVKRFGPDGIGSSPGVPRTPAGAFAFGVLPIQFDTILRSVNVWWDRVVDAARAPTHADRKAMFDAIAADRAAAIARLGSRTDSQTVMLRLVLEMLPGEMGGAVAQRERVLMEVDLARVAMLLAVHRAKTGMYPERLAELGEKTVPADRYSGGLVKYRREGEGFVVYSAGPNGVDDGGERDTGAFDLRTLTVTRGKRDDIAVKVGR